MKIKSIILSGGGHNHLLVPSTIEDNLIFNTLSTEIKEVVLECLHIGMSENEAISEGVSEGISKELGFLSHSTQEAVHNSIINQGKSYEKVLKEYKKYN